MTEPLNETEVDARLQECSRLSQYFAARPTVDMSVQGITARIEELAEISALCFELAESSRLEKPAANELAATLSRGRP